MAMAYLHSGQSHEPADSRRVEHVIYSRLNRPRRDTGGAVLRLADQRWLTNLLAYRQTPHAGECSAGLWLPMGGGLSCFWEENVVGKQWERKTAEPC